MPLTKKLCTLDQDSILYTLRWVKLVVFDKEKIGENIF